MRIGILTHYDVNNQGAQLQMYALYHTIQELGHTPIILTYEKNYDFEHERKLRYQPSLKSLPHYIKTYLFKYGISSVYRNYKKLRINKKYRKKEFEFAHYASANLDAAVIGSDEVFSIPMGVNIMMYGHCVNTGKIIAYAPSFGQTDIELLEKRHAKELVKSGLKNFIALSARDKNTKDIIEQLTGQSPEVVCDPVFLYDFKEKVKETKKILRNKYMVVYAYDFNMNKKDEIKAIRCYAKKHNLEIVSPGTYHSWCDKNINCNILEWIDIFRNAECVLTDTFHGTIASLISNKQVAVIIRDSINNNKMTDLLYKMGISNRKLESVSEETLNSVFENIIDFNEINNRIDTERIRSMEYLKTAIEKCKL